MRGEHKAQIGEGKWKKRSFFLETLLRELWKLDLKGRAR